MKRLKWTPEEENILRECIEECSTLTKAFALASKRINRSANAIQQHHYLTKKKPVLVLHENKSVFRKFITSLRNLFI